LNCYEKYAIVPSMKPLIYVLEDPRGGSCYVGYTTNLFRRIHYHYRDERQGRKGQPILLAWLKELAEVGILPQLKVLEWIKEGTDWQSREQHWIAEYKRQGRQLINIGDGGHKIPWPWENFTSERKERVSKTIAGTLSERWKNLSPDQREQQLAWLAKGRKGNRSNKGRKLPESQRSAISEGLKKAWAEGRRKINMGVPQFQHVSYGICTIHGMGTCPANCKAMVINGS